MNNIIILNKGETYLDAESLLARDLTIKYRGQEISCKTKGIVVDVSLLLGKE